MSITQEIMFIYGMTFLISMFVALIIKVLAKIVERLPEGNISFGSLISHTGRNVKLAMVRNRKLVRDFKQTEAGSNDELLNFYHER